ncbi:MAG: RNA polymerase sigma factor [Clostridiales bacterium]|nr:RNA polymerase sigma factor [Clostridiales bacterium]
MDGFEELLRENLPALERFVKFRISNLQDAEDVIQETMEKAFLKFGSLKDEAAFKPWLIAIARNLCRDHYRNAAKNLEVPLETIPEPALTVGLHGRAEEPPVSETLELLREEERRILTLFYLKGMPQSEIAKKLGIPVGTVKSRLHYAKKRFKEAYAGPEKKGEKEMKKLPEIMPDYKITPVNEAVFPVKWEELMGWFIVPKLGEKLSWAMYDFPERKRTELCEMEVLGKAMVHGIEGVEIRSVEYDPMECNSAGGQDVVERHLIAQLTDTHCRMLAMSYTEDGVKRFYTFLDGDDFLDNWGFGEDNCGNEVDLAPKGDIKKDGGVITTADKKFLLDVVGRYKVEINGKEYDTVCVVDHATYMEGEMVTTEQYIDREGRTILWRRFNHDEWAFARYGKRWTEMLPDNERITVNGETYVHWYDCITDRIL